MVCGSTPSPSPASNGTSSVEVICPNRVCHALAAAGPLNPVEFTDVRTTADKLGPVVAASGGGVDWIDAGSIPDIRRVAPGRASAGHGWIGFRENGDYVVAGFSETPLLPGIAALLLAIGTLIAAWRREGR